jgi:hypothetical protein
MSQIAIKHVMVLEKIEFAGELTLRITKASQWSNLLFLTEKGSVGRE